MSKVDQDNAGTVGNLYELDWANADVLGQLIPDDAIEVDAGPTDGQWHLESSWGEDINILPVWNGPGKTYSGDGVLVGVVDDGMDYNHSEFSGRYRADIDYDFVGNNIDGGHKSSADKHGTAVGGTIAAANDGVGSTGVAYGAEITSFRLLGGGGISYNTVGDALSTDVDVLNNSWSWTIPFSGNEYAQGLVEDGLVDAVSLNRDGLGTVVVFSAGNDRAEGDNVNYNFMQNSRFTIAVAAGDQDGGISDFSNPGASLLVTAPGTSVYTADRTGSQGYSTGDYTTINGTSFSAPIVSGVTALMLEANGDLGYRDIQEILAYSAVQTDVGNATWEFNGANNWNGGGLHVSEDFGFGFVDATAAVRLAETWLITGNNAGIYSNEDTLSFNQAVNGSLNGNTINSVLNIGQSFDIQYVGLQLNMTHNRQQDLTITLTSPDGTESLLFDTPPLSNDYGALPTSYASFWELTSTQHWGESGLGDWTLSINDVSGGGTGTLTDWSLYFYGDQLDGDDTYVYTNEYGTLGAQAGRQILIDTGGEDTINAAAVSTDLLLNLAPGSQNTVAGNLVSISAGTIIENAIGGDGNDLIFGNNANNTLYGGRGNDTLDGGAGIDILMGGAGDDTYYVDSLSDIVIEDVGEGYDIVYSTLANYTLSANVEELRLTNGGVNVTGSVNDDALYGNEEINNIFGVNGNDRLYGMAGGDNLYGGEGNDILDGGAGDDYLSGENGNDTLYGGADNDQLYGGAGVDALRGQDGDDTLDGGADNDNLMGGLGNDAMYGGTGNDVLYGEDGNDSLFGQDGNDNLDGGAGDDTMVGGAGNDNYWVDSVNDVVTEAFNGGIDLVRTTLSHTLSANVENLTLLGASAVNGYGNNLDNAIYANSAANNIAGYGGNDFISAGSGDDTVDGGDGNDTIHGGFGVDTIHGGNGNDVIGGNNDADELYGDAGDDTLYGGAGADTLDGGADDDNLIAGSEADTLNGGTGNDILSGQSGDDIMNGGAGNDELYGGTGNDQMTGGTGNDVFVINDAGDVVIENAGEGLDTIRSYISYDVSANVENLLLLGGANIDSNGNALNNTIYGAGGANTINGQGGDDALYGMAGNDTLNGDAGNDSLYGGAGDDIVNGGIGNDILGGSSGNDTLNGDDGDDTLHGEWGDDTLSGGDGADTLYGGNAHDTLIGGAGNDNLHGDAGNDTYTQFNVGFGADTIGDSGGNADLIDLTNYNLADVASWQAVDSNADTYVDQLYIDFGGGDSLTVNNYFNNTHADDDLSAGGYGLMESIEFADATLGLSDVAGLIA